MSISCGHSFCRTCIQFYWEKPSPEKQPLCPQCRKRFRTYPPLKPNLALDHMLKQAGFGPTVLDQSRARPGDVACDVCAGMNTRAVKWCRTCGVAYCETHVRQHYTVEALQRHALADMSGDLGQLRTPKGFCKTDQVFICLVCLMESHKVLDTSIKTFSRSHWFCFILDKANNRSAPDPVSVQDGDAASPQTQRRVDSKSKGTHTTQPPKAPRKVPALFKP